MQHFYYRLPGETDQQVHERGPTHNPFPDEIGLRWWIAKQYNLADTSKVEVWPAQELFPPSRPVREHLL